MLQQSGVHVAGWSSALPRTLGVRGCHGEPVTDMTSDLWTFAEKPEILGGDGASKPPKTASEGVQSIRRAVMVLNVLSSVGRAGATRSVPGPSGVSAVRQMYPSGVTW